MPKARHKVLKEPSKLLDNKDLKNLLRKGFKSIYDSNLEVQARGKP